jgi:hypothetical protein
MSESAPAKTLTANQSDRIVTSFEGAPSVPLADALARAAHQMARLAEPGYDRAARYIGQGSRTVHCGTVRVSDEVTRLAFAGARSTNAVPQAYRYFRQHMADVRQAALNGIKDGLIKTDRFLRSTTETIGYNLSRDREYLQQVSAKRVQNLGFYVHAVRESRTVAAVGSLSANIKDRISGLRRWAASVTMGALLTVGLAARQVADNGARIGRYLSEGSTSIQVGATEKLRSLAQSRHARVAGYAVAAVGLIGLGYAGGMAAAHGGGQAHASTIINGVVASFGHDSGSAATGQAAGELARAANSAAFEHTKILATTLGHSAAGHHLVRLATEASFQPTGQSLHHPVEAPTLHGHHVHRHAMASPHGVRGAEATSLADVLNGIEAHKHAGDLHGAMVPSHAVQPDSHSMADVLNGIELNSIAMHHAAGVGQVQGHLAAVGANPAASFGSVQHISMQSQPTDSGGLFGQAQNQPVAGTPEHDGLFASLASMTSRPLNLQVGTPSFLSVPHLLSDIGLGSAAPPAIN